MIPLFSTDQIREVDGYAINQLGIPGLVLMENAALQIFNFVNEKTLHLERRSKIGIVCGKGNNGGDGFAAARQFANNGFIVNVVYFGNEAEMSPDCLSNFKILNGIAVQNENLTLQKFESEKDLRYIAGSDIIIDAVLGSGGKGELKEPYKSIVKDLNKINAFKVAVDIPTGLNADTGWGDVVFKSDLTVALGELKKGLFIGEGANCSGEIVKGNIGVSFNFFDKFEPAEYLIEPEDAYGFLPVKNKNANKYTAGKVLTIAGSGAFPGAASLTSRSSLKIGAGASVLCFPKSSRKYIYKKLSEVVVQPYNDEDNEILLEKNADELKKRIEWADVLAVGPGIGRDSRTQNAVIKILKTFPEKRIVLDADGIFAIGKGQYKELNLKNKILTPHHGEFANLLGIETAELEKDLLAYGKEFSTGTKSFLVLKGAPSIIFTPGREALINTTGNPGMAKFGTGDVLTGVIAGLLSQQKEIEDAVICGVYLHSLAADLLLNDFTEFGYTAEDIIHNLPKAIKFLRKSFA